jgi:hypothetical protein
MPKDRQKDVTYGSFTCTFRPEKADPTIQAGGDKIYPGEVAAPTADMLVAKILFNSVISTPGARFGTMDISNFYLMTPLLFQNTFEYTSPTFQTKSYKNTNSKTKQQPKVSSISKLSRACTVSLKQDY